MTTWSKNLLLLSVFNGRVAKIYRIKENILNFKNRFIDRKFIKKSHISLKFKIKILIDSNITTTASNFIAISKFV